MVAGNPNYCTVPRPIAEVQKTYLETASRFNMRKQHWRVDPRLVLPTTPLPQVSAPAVVSDDDPRFPVLVVECKVLPWPGDLP